MARGTAGVADAARANANKIGATENTNQQGLENQLIPGYTSQMNTGFVSPDLAQKNQSLIDTGYLSPEDKGAAETSEMGAATQPFESMGFEAANRAARTNNPADLTAQQDQLALDEGRTAGGAAADLQREKMHNQEAGMSAKNTGETAGMYGLGGLRGEDLSAMESMYGMVPSLVNARTAGGGWSQGFKDVGSTLTGFGRGLGSSSGGNG